MLFESPKQESRSGKMDNSDFFKRISDFEQAAANIGQLANFLGSYHKSLCESGFNREESIQLVKQFQTTLFKKCFDIKPPEENNYDDL